jgi:cardiolipin synthase
MDSGEAILADFLFLLAISSDFADGYLARELGVSSKFGANLDVSIDFLFITGVFLYFTIRGIYPAWVLIIITAMFVQFLVTSNLTIVIFDPVGKYYGSLLYGAIGLTMLFPGQIARDMITVAFVGVSVASLSSRLIYLKKWGARLHHNKRMKSINYT